jgi:hypothetical protein
MRMQLGSVRPPRLPYRPTFQQNRIARANNLDQSNKGNLDKPCRRL